MTATIDAVRDAQEALAKAHLHLSYHQMHYTDAELGSLVPQHGFHLLSPQEKVQWIKDSSGHVIEAMKILATVLTAHGFYADPDDIIAKVRAAGEVLSVRQGMVGP